MPKVTGDEMYRPRAHRGKQYLPSFFGQGNTCSEPCDGTSKSRMLPVPRSMKVISNPQPNPTQPNPQKVCLICTSAYFGSPRGLVSYCNTYPCYLDGRGLGFESPRAYHILQ